MLRKTLLATSAALAMSGFVFGGSASASISLEELSAYSGLSVKTIEQAMAQATYQDTIIKTMTKPYESKPWHAYRKLFITKDRVQKGVAFYLEHEKILNRAQSIYGVPPEIVCAIIGVETFYGRNMGTWSVLDALYTLGFHYPPREAYFSKEFTNYIKLAASQGWPLTEIKGSYAGAMGMGQFMPSSYLNFAVDFNADGHINLFNDVEDAIGSVANYFKEHGWMKDRGILYPAHVKGDVSALMQKEWNLTADELYRAGVSTKVNIEGGEKVRLYSFDLENNKKAYTVAMHNFYVITRYNKSPLYAAAIYELSEYIAKEYRDYKNANGQTLHKTGRRP
ncbi:Membrane-bound lytic murein transglycosylase B precursor [Anaerobiospirillum thomasii]|uniref:lytic murein transglycosylase B n=1 Tax=Anaerobiospirillum thomasii TaxID=179995 RepID=UPI000D910CFB|nr:lytic murein transglycosylase B [Anaerobiospirillum thomasii]SPT71699.1 Membrane-bound lytic murein transglycosylase B precursor [Anaerobiospirillum thomasii]